MTKKIIFRYTCNLDKHVNFLCFPGDAQTRLLKLQLENQRLETELESLKLDSMNQYSEKVLELEKENKRLSTKVRLVIVLLFYIFCT